MPEMRKMCVWSLSWEDPLEESMATHLSIPDGKVPWTEEPGALQSMGMQRVWQDWVDTQWEVKISYFDFGAFSLQLFILPNTTGLYAF